MKRTSPRGATTTDTAWGIADGIIDAAAETYILIANTNSTGPLNRLEHTPVLGRPQAGATPDQAAEERRVVVSDLETKSRQPRDQRTRASIRRSSAVQRLNEHARASPQDAHCTRDVACALSASVCS
jgi:hypothetical protein